MLAASLDQVWVRYRPPRRSQDGPRHWSWALSDVTLGVNEGEWLGVIGGNGSGKTTLLRTLVGVYQPTKGRVHRPGRAMSVIDLTPGMARELSGHEYLRMSAAVLGVRPGELRSRRPRILDLAGLPDNALDQPVYAYSAGMMLRLMLALAISCEPAVLAVDEVLAVADLAFRDRSLELMADLCRNGTAVVMASHDLEVMANHPHRVAVLDRGALVVVASPEEAIATYSASTGAQATHSGSANQ